MEPWLHYLVPWICQLLPIPIHQMAYIHFNICLSGGTSMKTTNSEDCCHYLVKNTGNWTNVSFAICFETPHDLGYIICLHLDLKLTLQCWEGCSCHLCQISIVVSIHHIRAILVSIHKFTCLWNSTIYRWWLLSISLSKQNVKLQFFSGKINQSTTFLLRNIFCLVTKPS
jgi:hypothetical protein